VVAAVQAMNDLIDGRDPAYSGILFEAIAADRPEDLSPTARRMTVRKLMSFVKHDAFLHSLALHPALLAVVRRMIGSEPELFQDMALLKPPGGREKPWHQDKAYFDFPVDTPVVGVWIALDEATVENGCMHVFPRSHREGPQIHFQRRDWQICDSAVIGRSCTAVPLPPGGCLFFDGLLAHGTPRNLTDQRRQALQFHYAPADRGEVSTADRMAVFGSEGRDVSC
ncbi:MAG: phytanoyl-CoA dioxygenase family protein, partial [Chloroflexi bacterium]|nr:phytanoyl-CoA dioxygenase family protein [Chloroflexota bacterium]